MVKPTLYEAVDLDELLSSGPRFHRPRIVQSIRGFWFNLYYGVKNLIDWFPLIWKDRDWDWAFTVYVLKFKLNKQRVLFEKYGSGVNAPKHARNLLVCTKLLDRLVNDEYHDLPRFKELYKCNRKQAYKWVRQVQRNDLKMLFRIMEKNLLQWWD